MDAVRIKADTFMKEMNIRPEDEVDLKFLHNHLNDCIRTLSALLRIHTSTKGCCPDITNRLELTISYVKDVELE